MDQHDELNTVILKLQAQINVLKERQDATKTTGQYPQVVLDSLPIHIQAEPLNDKKMANIVTPKPKWSDPNGGGRGRGAKGGGRGKGKGGYWSNGGKGKGNFNAPWRNQNDYRNKYNNKYDNNKEKADQ